MNIRELKCFQLVYDCRSFNRASKQLYITAQGLGRIIDNLEKELSAGLFVRSAQGLTPTEAADILYEHAGTLIRHFEMIENAITQSKEKEDKLRINCARGVLNALSFSVLTNFMKANPNIEVTWKEMSNELVQHSVQDHAADIGLIVGGGKDENLCSELLGTKRMCILAYQGHPYYDREALRIEELDKQKIITLNEQFHVHRKFKEICKKEDIFPEIIGLTEDSHLLYKMCKEENGLGVLLDFSTDEFKMDTVRVIPLEETITWDIYMICQKKNRHYRNVQLFWDYIQAK